MTEVEIARENLRVAETNLANVKASMKKKKQKRGDRHATREVRSRSGVVLPPDGTTCGQILDEYEGYVATAMLALSAAEAKAMG